MKKFLNSWTGILLKILGICSLFILILYIVLSVVNSMNDAPNTEASKELWLGEKPVYN